MRLVTSILLVFSLLLQVWPARTAVRVEKKPKCGMSCCASLPEDETAACGCAETPLPPEPASTVPVTGRDLIPQVAWVFSSQWEPSLKNPPVPMKISPQAFEPADLARSHVRLPVLFCSILI
jgi:hypothetical protein